MRFYTLVTGASTGIGRALAVDHAENGSDIVLVARSSGKLQELAGELKHLYGVDVRICCQDLSETDAAFTVYSFCQQEGIGVDCLINCAGFSEAGDFVDMKEDDVARMAMVNMVAVSALIRLFLPPMLERKRGVVINIASLAGFQGVPGMACYSATKAFVIRLTEALSGELTGSGVRIFAVCPGFIDNDQFYNRAGHDRSRIIVPVSGIDVVIRAVRKGINGDSVLELPTVFDHLLIFFQRLLPRRVVIWLAGFFAGARSRR
jgi:short-subunit dehydrogenase